MCPPAHQDNYGKVASLYTYYSTLNRMFKKKIDMRVGDKKKLWWEKLACKDERGASRFNVFAFVWDEIKDISCSPLKIQQGWGMIVELHMCKREYSSVLLSRMPKIWWGNNVFDILSQTPIGKVEDMSYYMFWSSIYFKNYINLDEETWCQFRPSSDPWIRSLINLSIFLPTIVALYILS